MTDGWTASEALGEFSRDEVVLLDQVRQHQEDFQKFLRNRKNLSKDEKRCFEHASVNEASEYWIGLARRAISDHEEKRNSKWSSWARSTESAAEAASQFMSDLRPLLNAATSASPEAGLAIGVISGLFALVSSRPRMDDLIVKQMAAVLERMPGFRMLETIYEHDHPQQAILRRKIYLAIQSVVDFAIAATRYHLKSGLSRWWIATFDPSRLTSLAETMHEKIFEVRRKSEELLVLTIDELRIDNKVARLSIIRGLLDLRQWSSKHQEQRLREHKRDLELEERRVTPLDWMSQSKITEFRRRKDFCEWQASTEPRMFLIIAESEPPLHASVSRYCWMSPLAVSIIEEHCQVATRQNEAVFCVVDIDVRPSVHDLASELLFGILRIQENFDVEELSAKLETYRVSRRAGSEKEKIMALKVAASTVIHLLARQTPLFIVIDQIHWCKQQWDLLQVLIHILNTALTEHCCIKIFAVAHDMFYNLHRYQLNELHNHPLVQTCIVTQKLPVP